LSDLQGKERGEREKRENEGRKVREERGGERSRKRGRKNNEGGKIEKKKQYF
jgi:hypothetical protein